jgi:adenine-specific DNA-methyltransferase
MDTDPSTRHQVSAEAWARTLGLAHAPLFADGRAPERSRVHGASAMLDGRLSSFALCLAPDYGSAHETEVASWAWSANLRHVVVVCESESEVILRRWDTPEYRRFRLEHSRTAAEGVLRVLGDAPPLRVPDVVLCVLDAFRRIMYHAASPIDGVRVLNGLLFAVASTRTSDGLSRALEHCRTMRQVRDSLDEAGLLGTGLEAMPETAMNTRVAEVLPRLLGQELAPVPGLDFEPHLLLRHAAGDLYQEAHLLFEKSSQLSFPELAGPVTPVGRPPRDVRFTPTALARVLAEEALSGLGDDLAGRPSLDLLDPACGSGVFLHEALRELEARGYPGTVRLWGIDTSPIACAMATFCLEMAARDARATGMRVEIRVRQADALEVDWASPDVVLMNPPFRAYSDMSGREKELTRGALGDLGKGRYDKSMAFVWRAAQCLRPGGIVASVLPSPLLENEAGQPWREALASRTERVLVGRLRGHALFRLSTVEPAFAVLRRQDHASQPAPPWRELVADPGAEDAAIRGLRLARRSPSPVRGSGWEVTEAGRASSARPNWMPHWHRQQELVERLLERGLPAVLDLFDVHQGARTGRNEAFRLSDDDLRSLPARERRFFRPAATNSTIQSGRLDPDVWVFFPYGAEGPLLRTEEHLQEAVPQYFSRWLAPHADALRRRSRASERTWWLLTHERAWQWQPLPKLVSKYFGQSGGFAYDGTGRCVVLQGFAWLWRGEGRGANERAMSFAASPLPWAYVALLNSAPFEFLLSTFCPTVQGGQFDLSPRYLRLVPLPDLSDPLGHTGDAIRALARLGRAMQAGDFPPQRALAEPAQLAYGLAGLDWSEVLR